MSSGEFTATPRSIPEDFYGFSSSSDLLFCLTETKLLEKYKSCEHTTDTEPFSPHSLEVGLVALWKSGGSEIRCRSKKDCPCPEAKCDEASICVSRDKRGKLMKWFVNLSRSTLRDRVIYKAILDCSTLENSDFNIDL
ncbi:hypothetical protein RRG08_009623 [Elysia crispata]|uniref:Uncharacterized protein n=1 Tax=Elysia crispata TaxID=231223 RepID=A0AAE0XTU7_9GAST|nr:hypothetical protein RRG08_009623 [Elysia crispata]